MLPYALVFVASAAGCLLLPRDAAAAWNTVVFVVAMFYLSSPSRPKGGA